ncbi:hypothetical protein F5Y04DRAFT_253105 [Hypomontagnella monticulosa]|nr:hypothetical protein F5Y04DRAFT_253105 [Hypomontagnella monticulosa]
MASIRELLSSPTSREASTEPSAVGQDEDTVMVDVDSETPTFTVEFILDLICPYCYIGLKNLERAMVRYRESRPEATFKVSFLPYQLDPLAARSAYDKADYLDYLLGRPHTAEYWINLGQQAGITIHWDGRTGNTRDAHKLLLWALDPNLRTVRRTARAALTPSSPHSTASSPSSSSASAPAPRDVTNGNGYGPPRPHGPALQLLLAHALLSAHHARDTDLSSRASLTLLVSSATGHPASEVRTVVESEDWGRVVDALIADVTNPLGLAVRAVPTLVVNGRFVIGGLQSAEFLVGEFGRIAGSRGGVERRGDSEGEGEGGV